MVLNNKLMEIIKTKYILESTKIKLNEDKFDTKLNFDRKNTIKAINPFIKNETEIVFNNSMIPKSINL
jgi:hypothetical protein